MAQPLLRVAVVRNPLRAAVLTGVVLGVLVFVVLVVANVGQPIVPAMVEGWLAGVVLYVYLSRSANE